MTDHLLASVADRLAEANWMFATVNRDEDSEPLDYPEPVPRPGEEREEREEPVTATTPAQPSALALAQFFR
ncbi:hypothetical protein [Streptomyces sp. NPDC059743]|uniref:hypothetical protein n=1 Tax=Streptomyces sp. NPDC059743 TaxID=3346928 RepID=UPI00364E5A80